MRRVLFLVPALVAAGFACVGDNPDVRDSASPDAATEAAAAREGAAPGTDASMTDAAPGHCTGSFSKPEPIGGELNTSSNNEFPGRFSRDQLELYFARQHVGETDGMDLFVAKRTDDGGFDLGTKLENVNTSLRELEPSIGDDGGILVFASTRSGGPGQSDLYIAERVDASFGAGKLIPGLSSPGNDFQPFLAGNGAALYFTRVETNGDYQIYVSRRNGDGSFTAPELVKGQINTEDVEGNPVITDDELTIYFKRAPKGNVGPSNVFRARRGAVGEPFGYPEQVPELNTFTDDAPGWVSSDECTIIIVSKVSGTSDLLIAHRDR